MSVQIPFPLPATGFALNSKMRINLDFLVAQFNEFNTGTATWDQVGIGIANSETGTLTFWNASNANYLTFQAGATSANTTFTLPAAVPSASHKFLSSTTGGVMSWSIIGETGSNYAGNLVLYIDGTQTIQELATGSGNKVLVNSSPPSYSSLVGTTNQISVSPGTGTYTFSTPQDIGTSSNVQFNRGIFAGGSASSPAVQVIASGASNNTGMWAASGTELDFSVAGINRGAIDNTGLLTMTGGLNAPAIRATTSIALSTSTSHILTMRMTTGGAADYTISWPNAQGGASTIPQNDGSGNLTWVSVSAAGGATKALDNLASTAVNASIIPVSNAANVDLGSSSILFTNIYGGTVNAGQSGFQGTFVLYPSTASKGSTLIQMSNNSGATNTTMNFATQAGSRTYTVPDAGASASFVMTQGTQTIAGSTTFSATAGNPIHGTSTNDSASAGYVGEYIESVVASVAGPTSGQYKDVTSITLAAGDWDVTLVAYYDNNGATAYGSRVGISTTSGNSGSGLVVGSNASDIGLVNTAIGSVSTSVPAYRISLSTATTYYFKWFSSHSTATPIMSGRLSARRVR